MKRSLALLFTALLALSLTACGRDRQSGIVDDPAGDAVTGESGAAGTDGGPISGTPGAPGSDGTAGTGDSGMAGNGDAITGTPGAAGSSGSALTDGDGTDGGTLADDAANALKKGAEDIAGGAARMGGASYHQMVRNARVHDADGDLKDMENAVTPGSAF